MAGLYGDLPNSDGLMVWGQGCVSSLKLYGKSPLSTPYFYVWFGKLVGIEKKLLSTPKPNQLFQTYYPERCGFYPKGPGKRRGFLLLRKMSKCNGMQRIMISVFKLEEIL